MTDTSATQFKVKGKTAIVTGAGSGINFEFAKLLLENDCNVVIGDLALRPEASELVEKHQSSPRAVYKKTDVTNWSDLNAMFDVARREFGSFDIVCPGAGVFEPPWSNFWQPPGAPGSASKDPVEGLGHYAVLDINVTHPIRCTQLAIAEFLNPINGGAKVSPANPKRVVHIASVAAEVARFNLPMYIASKHAIGGFVRGFAEMEPSMGIRVNALCPGNVRTPLYMEDPDKVKFFDEKKDKWILPREAAETLLKLVEDPDMTGGTMLELGGNNVTRKIPLLGNVGPQQGAAGFTLSNGAEGLKEVYERLAQPNWGHMV